MQGLTEKLRAFYRGKRVLVTGHTGLKGSWLALWLHRLGAEVHGIALPATSPRSMFESAKVGEICRSELFDVNDLAALKASIARTRPEIVFHLAAQAIVGLAFANPVETFSTNVMGSVNVLEAVRHVESVRAVVMITSDKCYENVEQEAGYKESDRLGGDDPYGASKAAAEIVIHAYVRSYFTGDPAARVATARAGNVIGGGDWSQFRLVPDCIRALRAGEKIRIRHPRATRPWQHVLEPLGGYLLLGMCLSESRDAMGSWNLGPPVDNGGTVERGTREVIRHWGAGEIELVPGTFPESMALQLDSTLAREKLGWHTLLDFPGTIDWTTAWYRHQFDTKDGPMRDFSHAQIAAFEKLLDEKL